MTGKERKLRWGTSHFATASDARVYYARMGTDYRIPLAEGSISIGLPKYDSKTQRIGTDSDGRYWIEDK
jgi:hypothetical protein